MAKSKKHERISKKASGGNCVSPKTPNFFWQKWNLHILSLSIIRPHLMYSYSLAQKHWSLYSFIIISKSICNFMCSSVQYSVSAKWTKKCSWTENNLKKKWEKVKMNSKHKRKNYSTSAISNWKSAIFA